MIDVDKLPQHSPEFNLEELFEAGCHFGHQAKKWHPKMADWIYGKKQGIHIFDLAKTAQQLAHAYNYAFQLGQEGKVLVILGTKRQAKEVIEESAKKAGAMYITSRWLGGFLTNWQQVGKSLRRMIKIEEGLKDEKYEGYTKYERVQLEKQASRLGRFFDGLRGLKKIPDALFVLDARKERVAVQEAVQVGIPVIAVVDSNTDPSDVDLVIPANDDAAKSIELIIKAVAAGYGEGRKAGKTGGKVEVKSEKTNLKK